MVDSEKYPRDAFGMCAPIEVRISSGRGLGLFAKEFLPKGTLIWKYEGSVIEIAQDKIEERLAKYQNNEEICNLLDHAYAWKDILCEIINDGNLFNHSIESNIGFGEAETNRENDTYTIRDIQPGEELVDNYLSYDQPEWLKKIWEKYGVSNPTENEEVNS